MALGHRMVPFLVVGMTLFIVVGADEVDQWVMITYTDRTRRQLREGKRTAKTEHPDRASRTTAQSVAPHKIRANSILGMPGVSNMKMDNPICQCVFGQDTVTPRYVYKVLQNLRRCTGAPSKLPVAAAGPDPVDSRWLHFHNIFAYERRKIPYTQEVVLVMCKVYDE